MLVKDDNDGRVEWKGLSGQLRAYTTSIENKLAVSASAIDVVLRVQRDLQEAIGSRSDTANDTVLEENRTLRMDVNQIKEDNKQLKEDLCAILSLLKAQTPCT